MSAIEINFLKFDSGVIKTEELPNASGGAVAIWDEVAQKYLEAKPFAYIFAIEKVWPLFRDKNVDIHVRGVLGMTYDDCVVEKKDFARAATDIKKCLEIITIPENQVNHWPKIKEMFESNPDCDAIGFNWTSTGDDNFVGEWNEETDEYDELDFGKFWSLYTELAKHE